MTDPGDVVETAVGDGEDSSRLRLSSIRAGEWVELVRLTSALWMYHLLHRFLSIPRLVGLYDPGRIPDRAEAARPSPERLARLSDGVLRRVYGREYCLKRSLLLYRALRRHGYPAVILFGVTPETDGLFGHAWVEIDGAPVAEQRDPRTVYTVTYRYPDIA